MRLVLLDIGDTLWTLGKGCACDTCKGVSFRILSSRMGFQYLLTSGKSGKVLIDTSPDLRGQLPKAGVSRINVIPLTHPHYDHYA
jgi:phosphoribosyl 1,2-cyclic phosphate phosphodiesterase